MVRSNNGGCQDAFLKPGTDTANDFIKRYGIDLKGSRILYSPDLPQRGMSFGDGIVLGESAFQSLRELGETIVHELKHVEQRRRSIDFGLGTKSQRRAWDEEAEVAVKSWSQSKGL